MNYPCNKCIVLSVCDERCTNLIIDVDLLNYFSDNEKNCPDCGSTSPSFVCDTSSGLRDFNCTKCNHKFIVNFTGMKADIKIYRRFIGGFGLKTLRKGRSIQIDSKT